MTWTPHLYDLNTFVRALPDQLYWRCGKIVVARLWGNNINFSGVNTMIQIRNCPMGFIAGGSVYIGALSKGGADTTIQAATEGVYLRPNITSASFTDAANPGWVSMMLIGIEN
jgi:hypothetical protein